MTRSNIEAIYDLTPLQQGMLYHTVSAEDSAAYNLQMAFTLEGYIDEKILEQSWQKIVKNYTALRTSFAWEKIKKPYQIVNREVDFTIENIDLSDLPEVEQKKQIDEFIKDDMLRPLKLNKPPLMRLSLIRQGAEKHQLIWTFSHIILEGWSAAIILAKTWQLYKDLTSDITSEPSPAIPYVDYINWLKKQDQNKAEKYWKENLKGFTTATQLPIDKVFASEVAQVTHIDNISAEIPIDKTLELKAMARNNKLTLNTLVQGMWSILLSRYSGEEDIVFGGTVSGRPAELANVEHMVGMFVNTLPVRCKVSGNEQLIPWLQELQLNQAAMRQYEYSSLMQIKSNSELKGGQPLFNTLLVFENWLGEFSSGEILPGITISNIEIHETSDQPITLLVNLEEKISLLLRYDTNRFDKSDIEGLLKHYTVLLENVLSDSIRQISELSMLSARERQQILFDWNNTGTDYALNKTLSELFEAQVDKTPDNIALTFENDNLTYLELDQRANQLAHCLRENRITAGDTVSVFMARSLEMVIALYGIHKSGAAYVPLDPEYPAERLSWMLEDTGSGVILSQVDLLVKLPANDAKVICLDGANWQTEIGSYSESRLVPVARPDDIAYIIYTSGSTGKPKGVMNAHSGIVNRLLWMQSEFSLTPQDNVLQKTPYSFDVSVWEFFWPLITGAHLVIARPESHKDPAYLSRVIEEQNITTLHFVPSMLRAYLESTGLKKTDSKQARSLKRVICSGEALPYDLQQQFFQQSCAELHNLYGPTEAAIDVSHWVCRENDERKIVPIGYPIANTCLYILDAHLQLAPVGVAGELHIGGVQVAQGYLNRQELTDEKFIADPFSKQPGARLYKTGDRARYLQDGSIEYLGRLDNQVKLRGFRIEPGEIEAVFIEYDLVSSAAVIVREDKPGDQRLVAYLIPKTGAAADAVISSDTSIQECLKLHLPAFMVPAYYEWMDAFPLSPNGKLNYREFPQPSRIQKCSAIANNKPKSEMEIIMANIWEELLEINDIETSDMFFDLGGHSLLTLKVVERFASKTGVRLSHLSLINQTLRQLAAGAERSISKSEESSGDAFISSIKKTFLKRG